MERDNQQLRKDVTLLKLENLKLIRKIKGIHNAVKKAYELVPEPSIEPPSKSEKTEMVIGFTEEQANAFLQQSKATYDALELSIMMTEQRVQETRRNLSKYTQMMRQSVEAQVPVLQITELADLAICSQMPFGTLPSK